RPKTRPPPRREARWRRLRRSQRAAWLVAGAPSHHITGARKAGEPEYGRAPTRSESLVAMPRRDEGRRGRKREPACRFVLTARLHHRVPLARRPGRAGDELFVLTGKRGHDDPSALRRGRRSQRVFD